MSDSSKNTSADTTSLFRPFSFGSKEISNRVVMAPMTRSKSPGKVPGEDVAAYYRRRAEGGVGLIVTEGTNPGHPAASAYPDVPDIAGEEALAGWKRVVEEVHEAGGLIIPQLWHCGSIRKKGMEPDPEVPGFAPSPVVHPSLAEKGDEEVPHEMTQQDIDDTIAAFAASAKDAKEVGFDGVEIHGAHSYLVDQFFWEVTNKRADKYGGETLVERAQFGVELVEAVRKAVGPDFPIVFRFSQWKQGDYKHKMAKTPEELGAFLKLLSDAGVDVFHCSTRRFNTPEFEGSDLNLAGWTKKLTGKPVITVGSVGLDADFLHSFAGKSSSQAGLDDLIKRLDADEFDMVAVGRAVLADPEWANKVRDGKESEIDIFTHAHLAELT